MADGKTPSMAAWSLCIGISAALPFFALAQTQTPQTQPPVAEITFPDDMELKVLIDYVGKRLELRFLYDEQIGGKRLTLKMPRTLPVSSLMSVLDSALRMKGLTMRHEPDGIIRIELARQLTAHSTGPTSRPSGDELRPGTAVTRIFEIKHAAVARADEVIKPFLSTQTASTTALPEHRLIIVTDYAENMQRLQDLVDLIDRPTRSVQLRFVPLKHVEAATVAQKVTQLLAGKAKAAGAAAAPGATLIADERGNQIMLLGSDEDLAEASQLIASIDAPLGVHTKTYAFTAGSAEQVDRLIRDLLGEVETKRVYRSAADTDANLLVATTTPEIHAQIESLRQAIDKPLADTQSPIRFYRLKNAKATEIVQTLQSIEGDAGLANTALDNPSGEPKTPADPPVANEPGNPRTAPEARASLQNHIRGPGDSRANRPPRNPPRAAKLASLETGPSGATRIIADEPSNTIIVVAKPAMHAVYEKLVRQLDVRRPQVLVEATVVALDTTNDFSLGVEVSGNMGIGNFTGVTFSSFGLSTPNPDSGKLALRPGTGFNGVLLAPDVAQMVIRALQTDSRAKVVSRPSILVNDNAIGELASENEEPFASVNASATVATTSFAGYSSAGTKITITPQISEGECLKLKYEVTLSNFGADKSTTLPPSRQTTGLASEVTIPDGHTIVVGGLTRENYQETIDRLPILGTVPVVEYLFSNRTKAVRKSTLFVFIRAVVLRADKFEDLKTLSRDAVAGAGIRSDLPSSQPLEIR